VRDSSDRGGRQACDQRVARLPKERSGKILRGHHQVDRRGETWPMPATSGIPRCWTKSATRLKGRVLILIPS